MTGPYFCVLLGSRSICSGSFVQVDRQARCGIVTILILESTLTFSFSFFFLRYAWCYLSLTTYTWYITIKKVYLVYVGFVTSKLGGATTVTRNRKQRKTTHFVTAGIHQ